MKAERELQKWEVNRYKYYIYDDLHQCAYLTNDVEDVRRFTKHRSIVTMIKWFPKDGQWMIAFL